MISRLLVVGELSGLRRGTQLSIAAPGEWSRTSHALSREAGTP
jgi:uncharacterized cupin superfamily protein